MYFIGKEKIIMYGISVYNVPIVNKYVFNFYCEDKEALELFSKAFKEFEIGRASCRERV